MAVSNAAPYNFPGLKDANFVKTVALPIAANTANTNAFDLVQATPFPTSAHVVLQVVTGVSSNTANSKNINIRLMDSADNISFANVAAVGNPFLQVTDSGGTTAAGSANIILPPGIRRYVKVAATGEANGGNASDATLTASLLFGLP